MKIVVTGAAGYIGSCLCKMLLDKFQHIEIKAFDNLHYNQWESIDQSIYKDQRIKLYKEDCTEWSNELKIAITKADFIFPLAAIVGAPACDKIPEISTAINFKWFEEMLGLLDGSQKVIYPNTNSGYGTTPKDSICTEETPSNPISLYGKLKQASEDLLRKYENCVCFRLATVFGLSGRPRLDLMVNNFVYRAINDGYLDIFDGHYRRNFISVKDVCRAFIFATDSKNFDQMKGQVFNLGTDELNSTKIEFAKEIQRIVGCRVTEKQFKTDPDKRDYLVSNKKLNDVGFYSQDITLDQSVEEMANFCRGIENTQGMFNY